MFWVVAARMRVRSRGGGILGGILGWVVVKLVVDSRGFVLW